MLTFFKSHIVEVIVNVVTSLIILLLIVAPQTHIMFVVIHFEQLERVTNHLQQVNDDYGKTGLDKAVKDILDK